MNELQIFKNKNFEEVRVIAINDEPWFVGKDIAENLGYINSSKAVIDHVAIEDKQFIMLDLADSQNGNMPKGQTKTAIINESGLYSLILSSKLPQAKEFKRWVTSEVLPTIRKHGAYMTETVIERTLTDPDYLIQLATTLKDERQRRLLAEEENERNKPKVLFSDSCEVAENSILIGEFAKRMKQNGLPNMGQNRLFTYLRNQGYLCKNGERRNQPTQKSMEQGLFETKVRVINNPDGSTRTTTTTKMTGKGQIYFTNKLLGEQSWQM
ncbi:phage antirepressor [Peptoniphilus duerdenii]|uniref:phage antirepressor n=1 Tax=Peptoniphilus duerdenii TaxID=507750 RepID=UPI0023F55DBC|nr:phage antirepressor [Peptoniphilus duerdenii]